MADGRSVIKQSQTDILEVLYKYRFGSRLLIAEALNVSPVTLHKKLAVLIKHKLVASRYDGSAKISGKPVAYFLTPKGLRFLKSQEGSVITDDIIKASYRDKVLTAATIDHSLQVFAAILHLKRRYPALKAYLRRDMIRFSYFPKQLPDAFLSLSGEDGTARFFLDVVPDAQENKPLFQRVSAYIAFFDIGGWNVTNTDRPLLIFIAERASTERRITRIVKGTIAKTEPDEDPIVYTTTKRAIEGVSDEPAIWTNIDDPGELLSLDELE